MPRKPKKKVKSITVAEAVDDAVNIAAKVVVSNSLAALLIGGTVESRAELYTESTYATYENNVAERESDAGVTLGRRVLEEGGESCEDCLAWASEEFRPLDELEEIGSSICGSRCRCEYEFQVEGEQFATSDLFSGIVGGQSQYGGSIRLD